MLNPDGPVNRVAVLNRTARTAYHPTPFMLFQPKKKGRAGWKVLVARKLWNLLERIGALVPYQEKIVTFTYTEEHRTRLNALAFDAYKAANAQGLEPDDMAFLIGAEDFRDLSRTAEDFHEFRMFTVHGGQFQFNRATDQRHPRIGSPMHRYTTTIHDIPVHVVPWMKGIAVVPKVLIEEKVKA